MRVATRAHFLLTGPALALLTPADASGTKQAASGTKQAADRSDGGTRAPLAHPAPADAAVHAAACRAGLNTCEIDAQFPAGPPPLALSGHAASLTPY